MSIIRQGSLFDIQDLYELEPSKRFESILAVVSKKSIYGAPTELNYEAMVYTLVARIVERIPTIKDLVKRSKQDYLFRLDCGFLFSNHSIGSFLFPFNGKNKSNERARECSTYVT